MNLHLNIHLDYGSFKLSCLNNIELNGITGILGHSGSGKTSLLRIIAGLNDQANGQVELAGYKLQDSDENQFILPAKRNIGFVFQDARLFPHLGVRGNLEFASSRCRQSKLTIDEVIELTRMEHLLDRKVTDLSAGEKQRVALARSLLAEPGLLLLDEPLSALDNKARGEMVLILRQIHQRLNLPMIYVSHSVTEIQQLADQVLVMKDGSIIQQGHVHQVINHLDSSISNEYIAQTSLTLKVKQHLVNFGLTQLGFVGQQQKVNLFSNVLQRKINEEVRCYVLASDIGISLNKAEDTSVNNILPGKITEIRRLNKNLAQVCVQVFDHTFMVNITRYSVERLRLTLEQPVYLQFKASAIRTY